MPERVAVVSGAARGIGAATAERLAAEQCAGFVSGQIGYVAGGSKN